jgi:hypothetical protein
MPDRSLCLGTHSPGFGEPAASDRQGFSQIGGLRAGKARIAGRMAGRRSGRG